MGDIECNRTTKLSKHSVRQWNWEGCRVKGESEKSLFKQNTRKQGKKKKTLKISKELIEVRHGVLCHATTVPADRGLQVLGLTKILHKVRRTNIRSVYM